MRKKRSHARDGRRQTELIKIRNRVVAMALEEAECRNREASSFADVMQRLVTQRGT